MQHHVHGAAARDLTVKITIVKVRWGDRGRELARRDRERAHSTEYVERSLPWNVAHEPLVAM